MTSNRKENRDISEDFVMGRVSEELIPIKSKRFHSSPKRLDPLWAPRRLRRELIFLPCRGVKLIEHFIASFLTKGKNYCSQTLNPTYVFMLCTGIWHLLLNLFQDVSFGLQVAVTV